MTSSVMRALNLNKLENIELNIDLIDTLLSNGGGIIDLGTSDDENGKNKTETENQTPQE